MPQDGPLIKAIGDVSGDGGCEFPVAPNGIFASRKCTSRLFLTHAAIAPRSAPPKPIDMISGHIGTCSSVNPSHTGDRLPIASGTSQP